ncbi:MAG: hypothetical protein AB1508_03725 [Pseudomonadota bacterium]
MVRLSIAVAAIVFLGCGSAALAQDNPAPKHAAHKAHAKKVESNSNSNDASEDWSIALPKSSGDKATDVSTDPNVAAGRKKFFEQSTTMGGGGPDGAHTGSSSGFTPSMGMSF